MKIVADLHTHTNVSHHSLSTFSEMVEAARQEGHIAIAITNHCPSMEDGAHEWHFGTYRDVPHKINGVYIIPGVEYDIMEDGSIFKFRKVYLDTLKWSIASFHEPVFPSSTKEAHTEALMKILENPIIDMLGHLGNPNYEFDMEKVISNCNKYGKTIEMNAHSFIIRPKNIEICREIAILCNKYKVPIFINSDAHVTFGVGKVDKVFEMLKEINFDMELVINADQDRFVKYFKEKKGIDILAD